MTGLQFIRRSGAFGFDLEVQGAVEAAGRAGLRAAAGRLRRGRAPGLLLLHADGRAREAGGVALVPAWRSAAVPLAARRTRSRRAACAWASRITGDARLAGGGAERPAARQRARASPAQDLDFSDQFEMLAPPPADAPPGHRSTTACTARSARNRRDAHGERRRDGRPAARRAPGTVRARRRRSAAWAPGAGAGRCTGPRTRSSAG